MYGNVWKPIFFQGVQSYISDNVNVKNKGLHYVLKIDLDVIIKGQGDALGFAVPLLVFS